MKLSLQSKLISATIIVTMLVSIIIESISFNQLKSTSDKSIQSETTAQSEAFTQYLSTWAADRSRGMSSMRTAIEAHFKQSNGQYDPDAIREILTQTKISLNYGMTFFGMEDGTMIRYKKSLDEGRTDNYDPRVRGWYKASKKAGKGIISKPYIAATAKTLAISFAEPVMVNGQLVGNVGGLVYMDEILSNILNLGVQGEGYAVLLDKANTIAVHPDKEMILQEVSVLNDSLSIEALQTLGESSELLNLSMSGVDSVVLLKDIPNTNWVLGLVMQESVLAQPVNALLMSIVAVVAVLIAVSALGVVFLIRWLFTDLKRVTQGLASIANGEGDLTVRINASSNDEIGTLATSFNQFVGYLHGIISNVSHVTDELGVQANNTANHAKKSADRVNTQQSEITMVSQAVDEMTKATRDIAQNAVDTAATADSAVSLTTEGQGQVRKSQESITALANEVTQTSEVILDLDKHAHEISSILATISGIAEQTNLLALNAAIEAARAGEQGRGFAVVADEVRVLSQRTHSSTEEIQSMIEVLQKTTQNAVKSMESSQKLTSTSVNDAETASESLRLIRESIVTINDMATQIATAAEEQSAVTLEINGNTSNINNAAQDLATQAGESKSRSMNLNKLTESLKTEVRRFKL